MASSFKSFGSANIGTSLVSLYTVPAVTTTTIIGLSIANVGTLQTTVDVQLVKGSSIFFLVKGAPIPPGGSLVVVGGDQKVVAEAGNIVKVISTLTTSCDAVISVLELT
jgi:hypothetical protein